tara:strand:+ start:4667 stop:4996 length:330 start_codon:yes stop_codon:yes gene_type:complete
MSKKEIISNYTKKEIISNYSMGKSEKQKEALKSNFYLQGFTDYIDIFLGENILKNISKEDKKNYANYIEGKKDAEISIKEIKNQSTKSEYKNFINKLQKIKNPSKSLKI